MGGSEGAEMVEIDLVSPGWLDPSVVAVHILFLVIEQPPEVVSLLLTHLEDPLGDYPVQLSILARRKRQ
jgi:hypothetical protein